MARAKRVIAIEHAKRMIGKAYIWRGQGPLGFDCSGLIVEALRSVGVIGRKEDLSADGLWHRFKDHTVDLASPGCLVFWDDDGDGRMSHVAMAVELLEDGGTIVIEAAGGDSSTRTQRDAQRREAMITIRPMRSGVVARVDPFRSG